MKTLLACLSASSLTLTLLSAQPQLEARLSAKLKPAPAQFGEVSEADKKVTIQKVATLLGQHVTFRNDGTASSYYDAANGRQHVEWRDLRIKMIVPMRLNPDDEKNNINKRIQVLLEYDASRVLDKATNSWRAWGVTSHPLFPPAINMIWQNGHPKADGGLHLPKFMPGPIASQATDSIQPADKNTNTTPPGVAPTQGTIQRPSGPGGLPPGMQRK